MTGDCGKITNTVLVAGSVAGKYLAPLNFFKDKNLNNMSHEQHYDQLLQHRLFLKGLDEQHCFQKLVRNIFCSFCF